MSRTGERDGRLRALILQHEDPTPPGLIGEWLKDHDAEVVVHRIDLDETEVDPGDFDLIVSLGSEFAAFDDDKPFVPREARLMRRALDGDVPVLGLCFGGQMLARVLGAEVRRSEEAEIGWLAVRSRDPDIVPTGPRFQWHFDIFSAPPGAEVIAETDVGPQAFVAGRSLGLQFHPEVTAEIMDEWVRTYRHELDGDGVDPDELLAETGRMIENSNRMARQLFDGFLERATDRADDAETG
jgi:GMP synthase-like glutamine amidotransferase